MRIFRVQKIRSCQQCGDVLAQKCGKCLKHPDRAPKVVEYFEWPKILKTCECACSVLVNCQNPACNKPVWRFCKNSKSGLSRSQNLFCSRACSCRAQNRARNFQTPVPCGWCKKLVARTRYDVKTFKAAYCCRAHYFLARKKREHEEKEIHKAQEETRALLFCKTCRDVTEHDAANSKMPACQTCKSRRTPPPTVSKALTVS